MKIIECYNCFSINKTYYEIVFLSVANVLISWSFSSNMLFSSSARVCNLQQVTCEKNSNRNVKIKMKVIMKIITEIAIEVFCNTKNFRVFGDFISVFKVLNNLHYIVTKNVVLNCRYYCVLDINIIYKVSICLCCSTSFTTFCLSVILIVLFQVSVSERSKRFSSVNHFYLLMFWTTNIIIWENHNFGVILFCIFTHTCISPKYHT